MSRPLCWSKVGCVGVGTGVINLLYVVVNMSVRNKNIEIAIVVVIDKAGAKTQIAMLALWTPLGTVESIKAMSGIAVERITLPLEISHKEIL